MKIIKIALIACITLVSFSSCKKGGVFCYKADGNIIKETRTLKDFSEISLELAADIYIEQNDTFSVVIETSKNLLEIIQTKVSGSTLKIKMKKGKCIKNDFEMDVFIKMPTLKAIDISGSGDVFIKDNLTVNSLDISISGSGDVKMDDLSLKNLDISISGSGDVCMAGVDTLDTQKIRISGSGNSSSINLPTKESDVKVSGSGDVALNVIEKLDASISGSGSIRYKGNPTLSTSISGSGSVSKY